jgi:nucleotide-binding universal stress UspA family protein
MARKSRYLVAIDFSAGSRRALETARRLAAETGASITLAHVRPFSDVRAAVVEERGELLRRAGRPLAREVAAHYAQRLDAWASEGEKKVLLRGGPDAALVRAARQYDLLLIGSHGRGAVASVLLGSTVQRVLAHSSRTPVLVVPAPRGSRR